MNMQVNGAAGGGADLQLQQVGQLQAGVNIAQATEKVNSGDLKGAKKELQEACNCLNDAGKGGEAQAPGQQLNQLEELLKKLREILEQGKKQSAESPANQAPQGGQGAQGGGQGGDVQELLKMIGQLLQQIGVEGGKPA